MKVLLITSRNVYGTSGELRLIKNRTETLLHSYGVETDILLFKRDHVLNAKQEVFDYSSFDGVYYNWKNHIFRFRKFRAIIKKKIQNEQRPDELEQLENIEISTWKLFNEHTDIMEQYDIRDYYELHNLLRKTVPAGSFHNFQCGRSPHIKFGVFDRDEAIRSIIAEHGPVSTTALCNLLRDTFGYEPAVSQANYLDAASKYYKNNVYFIKQRDMSAENKALLRNALTEDYYRLSDVREIYSNLVEHAEPAEVNANTLKEIGFTLTSDYVLRSSILPKEYLLQIIYEECDLLTL